MAFVWTGVLENDIKFIINFFSKNTSYLGCDGLWHYPWPKIQFKSKSFQIRTFFKRKKLDLLLKPFYFDICRRKAQLVLLFFVFITDLATEIMIFGKVRLTLVVKIKLRSRVVGGKNVKLKNIKEFLGSFNFHLSRLY